MKTPDQRKTRFFFLFHQTEEGPDNEALRLQKEALRRFTAVRTRKQTDPHSFMYLKQSCSVVPASAKQFTKFIYNHGPTAFTDTKACHFTSRPLNGITLKCCPQCKSEGPSTEGREAEPEASKVSEVPDPSARCSQLIPWECYAFRFSFKAPSDGDEDHW